MCNKINATIFKKRSKESDHIKDELNESLNNLKVGQNILIKINNIKYEQNDLFLIADYYSSYE